MLSYLHAYHAGNYADIHKHLALYLSLDLMHRKDSAISCFDTHAGRAAYDLDSDASRRTGEAEAGVSALWSVRAKLQSEVWNGFWKCVEGCNGDVSPRPRARRSPAGAAAEPVLRHYPGSPAWMAGMARPQDPLQAFELHPAEQNALDDWAREHRVRVFREDGFKGLIRLLPPATPRLLVLIDPPYELKTDYRQVVQTLEKAWRRCRHGVFLIWYPVLEAGWHQDMLSAIGRTSLRKVLHSQLLLSERTPSQRMLGSGMLLVNPPWPFAERFGEALEQALTVWPLPARHRMDWLIPE